MPSRSDAASAGGAWTGGSRRSRGILALATVLLLVLAGCVGGPGGVATPGTTSATPAGGTTAGDATTLAPGEGQRATVDRVIDGDTVVVTFANGTQETVRLLGVDTPEISSRNTPDEFEGVPETEAGRDCLRDWGTKAHAIAIEALSGEEVRIVYDETSDRRGYYGRLLAYVYVDGRSFNYRLVDEGYARVYESEFTQLDAYLAAEAGAMERGDGLWTCASGSGTTTATGGTTTATDGGSTGDGLSIAAIDYDAPGNDNDNPNEETITFENAGSEPIDLSGWTVADEAGHTYRFPEGTVLDPGESLTLHTGTGTDTATDLYWGSDRAIWNNGGDTVVVRNRAGTVVLRESY